MKKAAAVGKAIRVQIQIIAKVRRFGALDNASGQEAGDRDGQDAEHQ